MGEARRMLFQQTAKQQHPNIPLMDTSMYASKSRLDTGETVHEDTTPKDIFPKNSLLKHFAAGGFAGFCSRTATAPLDRVKLFIQVNKSYSIPSAWLHLYREGGLKGLWRGNCINVIKIAPESALKFMAYEEVKRVIKRNGTHAELNMPERFVAGALAGAFAQMAIYPLEVLKTRLALRRTEESTKAVFMSIWRSEPVRFVGFYKGFIPNLIGIFPYAGIDLAVYETLKKKWIRKHPDIEPRVGQVILCGIVSSGCGQVCTYPLALVRTRLQALAVLNDPNQPTNMTGQFKYIWRMDGLRGLYRGFIPNFFKVMPAVAISYVTYEKCRTLLGAKMS